MKYGEYLGRPFKSPIAKCMTEIELNFDRFRTTLKALFEDNLLHFVNNSIDDRDFINLSKTTNNYRLLPIEPLGSGTFASVFEVEKDDGIHLAIKLGKPGND